MNGTMHDLPARSINYSNRAATGKDQARLQETADQFMRVMIDSGFSAQDVAKAFLRAGMKLAQQIPASAPENGLQQLLRNAATATCSLDE